MRKYLAALGTLTILAAGCSSSPTTDSTSSTDSIGSTDGPVTLTLLAHESFTPSPGIFDAFTAATGISVEVVQGGIFRIVNVPEADLGPILGIGCPNILFPYAREVVADTVNRAGFPPVNLAPVNFEALFAQQGHSFPRFYDAVRELAALPKDQRHHRLRATLPMQANPVLPPTQ